MLPPENQNPTKDENQEICDETSLLSCNRIDLKDFFLPARNPSQNINNDFSIKIDNFIHHKKKSSTKVSLNRKNDCKRIRLNIGGQIFETYKSTLKLIIESRLANLTETNSDYDKLKKEYFFDRDPNSFMAILNYFRTGHLHTPQNTCGNLFYGELTFWGIDDREIQPCCWTSYSMQRDCNEMLNKVIDGIESNTETNTETGLSSTLSNLSKISTTNNQKCGPKGFYNFLKVLYWKSKPAIWNFLEDRNSSFAAYVFFWFSVIILCLSILVFIMTTSSYFRMPVEIALNMSLSRRQRESRTIPFAWLTQMELFCNIFFIIEFFFKFLSSPNKCKFLRNPYNYLEFLACTPIISPPITLENKLTSLARVHHYIEVFYILRILKIFILVPKYSGLKVLLLTIKNSLGELLIYFFMLIMTILIFASFIYYAEQIYETEENKFDSILISLYWAVVTITTLGYGDMVPTTPLGYIIGGLCALTGLVFLAMPIPVIVNNFATFYSHAKARQKLQEVSLKLKDLPNRALALQFQTDGLRFSENLGLSSNFLGMPPNLERKPHQRKNPKRLLKTKLHRTNRPKRITGVTHTAPAQNTILKRSIRRNAIRSENFNFRD